MKIKWYGRLIEPFPRLRGLESVSATYELDPEHLKELLDLTRKERDYYKDLVLLYEGERDED